VFVISFFVTDVETTCLVATVMYIEMYETAFGVHENAESCSSVRAAAEANAIKSRVSFNAAVRFYAFLTGRECPV
jgi:hypothetical protein